MCKCFRAVKHSYLIDGAVHILEQFLQLYGVATRLVSDQIQGNAEFNEVSKK